MWFRILMVGLVVAALLVCSDAGAESPLAKPPTVGKKPKLRFKQDGKDLVVTTTIEITAAPHVLWTHAELVMDHDPSLEGPTRPPKLSWVELAYHVIQCRDDPIVAHSRHRKKKVEVSWRLPGHRKADVPYRIVKQFKPSSAELTALAPQLEKIAEETRKRVPLAVP